MATDDNRSKEQRAATHTPGPWHADSVMGDDPHEICVTNPREGAGDPEVIATVFCDPGKQGTISLAEANANARLIAAAPELLAALQDCVERYAISANCICDWSQDRQGAHESHCPIYTVVTARAVIAKAEGRT